MSLCEDDAKLTGPIALFLGIETATWDLAAFTQAADWASAHGVTTLFIKVSEVGSRAGDIWYSGNWDSIYQEVQKTINVIPYAFVYGDKDIQKELDIAVQMLQKYGKYCLDMEGGQWGTPDAATRAKQFAQALAPLPGKLWVSCPADPVRNHQLPFLQALSPAVNIYMPMIYSNNLAAAWQGDFSQVNPQACVQPTLDLSQEFGPNDIIAIVGQAKSKGIHAISLWEYGYARGNTGLLQSVVAAFVDTPAGGGGAPVGRTNSKGEVADFPDVSQMEWGESEFECGFYAVGECEYAGEPGKGAKGTPESVDQWADSHGGLHTGGVSIDDMHRLFHEASLHYWDLDNTHVDMIKAALQHGYPVVVTVQETTVHDMDLGGNPYAPNWTPSGNHIFTITGIAHDGNFLVHDTAAIRGGIFGKVAPQPRHYRTDMTISWACAVRLPWLPAIPSGNPLAWPSIVSQPQPQKDPKFMEQALQDEWNSTGIGAPFDSGIAHAWRSRTEKGPRPGPPLNKEYKTVTWEGKSIVAQDFARARCEWDGSARWL